MDIQKHLINKQVIVLSNENVPMIYGTLIGFEAIHGTNIPIVKDDNNKIYHVMGIVLPDENIIRSHIEAMRNMGFSQKDVNAFLSRVISYTADIRYVKNN